MTKKPTKAKTDDRSLAAWGEVILDAPRKRRELTKAIKKVMAESDHALSCVEIGEKLGLDPKIVLRHVKSHMNLPLQIHG